MQYTVTQETFKKLIELPETGMGYQIISSPRYQHKILIINSSFGFDIDNKGEAIDFNKKGILDINVDLSNIIIDKNIGAIDAHEQTANGNISQQFIRLSAFEDDFRIDKENKCLKSGSFTTNFNDFWTLKTRITSSRRYGNMGFDNNDINPLERYALPTILPINFVFFFNSHLGDVFQEGIVQPAYNKKGGGTEYFFKNGTSKNTFHEMLRDEELKEYSKS